MGFYLLSCLSTQLDLQILEVPVSLVGTPASFPLKPNYWVYELYLLIQPFYQVLEEASWEGSQILNMLRVRFQNVTIVSVNKGIVTIFEWFRIVLITLKWLAALYNIISCF